MLSDAQLAAATSPAPRVLYDAGPGAGKTETVAARVAHLITSGRFIGAQIATITYTRSMAADLAERVALRLPERRACPACNGTGKIGNYGCGACASTGQILVHAPECGTLHSLAARWARAALAGEIAGGPEVRALGWIDTARFGLALPEDVADVLDAAYHDMRKKVRKRDLKAALLHRGAQLEGWPKEAAVRQALSIRGLATYDDLLQMLLVIAQAKPRPGVPHLRDRYPCVVLDEAPDFTDLHWQIIEAWNPAEITAAGDDAQRLYGFLARREGGTASNGFGDRVRSGEWEVHQLDANYRSAPEVVEAGGRVRDALVADGACTAVALHAARTDPGEATFVSAPDPWAETAADEVGRLLFGRAPGEVAVLARSWGEVGEVAALLDERGVPVAAPARSRDRWSTLAGRAVVALVRYADRGHLDRFDAEVILRALCNPDPRAVVEAAMRGAVAERVELAGALDRNSEAARHTPPGWWAAFAGAETLEDVRKLAQAVTPVTGPAFGEALDEAASWRPTNDGSQVARYPVPADWLLWLASGEDANRAEVRPDAVCVTTFHGAKGLEWPAVVVCGACEGGLPARWDKTPDDINESGRCLYVGITRARDAVVVVAPQTLRGKPRDPSRWLVAAELMCASPVVAEAGGDE